LHITPPSFKESYYNKLNLAIDTLSFEADSELSIYIPINPMIGSMLSFDQAQTALLLLEHGEQLGKIVVTI